MGLTATKEDFSVILTEYMQCMSDAEYIYPISCVNLIMITKIDNMYNAHTN